MLVHVKVHGALARPGGKDELDVELAEGARVEELLGALGYPPAHHRAISAFVGGERARPGRLLLDGDEVALMVIASGG